MPWPLLGALARGVMTAGRTAASATSRTAINVAGRALGRRNVLKGIASFKRQPLQSSLNTLWAIDSLHGVSDRNLARTTVGVTVRVQGSRFSDIGRLFYLATAIANGVCPRFSRAAAQTFVVNILHNHQFVEITIAYNSSGISGQVNTGLTQVKSAPQNDLFGTNKWPNMLHQNLGDNPALLLNPTTGRPYEDDADISMLIATHGLADNPYPASDFISRSSDFTAVFAAALMPSCAKVEEPANIKYTESTSGKRTLTMPGGTPVQERP